MEIFHEADKENGNVSPRAAVLLLLVSLVVIFITPCSNRNDGRVTGSLGFCCTAVVLAPTTCLAPLQFKIVSSTDQIGSMKYP